MADQTQVPGPGPLMALVQDTEDKMLRGKPMPKVQEDAVTMHGPGGSRVTVPQSLVPVLERKGWKRPDAATPAPDGEPDQSWTRAQLLAWLADRDAEASKSANKDELLAAVAAVVGNQGSPDTDTTGQPASE